MTVRRAALAIALGATACTYHAGIGGMGAVSTDGTTAAEKVPQDSLALLVGAGPCLRWPRLRTSLTIDGAVRGASAAVLAAGETMWLFDEGQANDGDEVYGFGIRSRTSLALKGRLAGGRNAVTDTWISEVGLGLAIVNDSDRHHEAKGGYNAGDFHAVSADVIATYAPDDHGDGEVWIGGQLTYHTNAFSLPRRSSSRSLRQDYDKAPANQSTDCNSGHLP